MTRLVAICLGGILWTCVAEAQTDGTRPDAEARIKAEVMAASKRIDAAIEARARKAGMKVAGPADPAQFYRRVNLDLVGCIPDLVDAADYVSDDRDEKRWIWTEKLFADPRFASHFANIYRAFLLPNNSNVQQSGLVVQFETFLRQKLQANVSYDSMVREILMPQNANGMARNFAFNGGVANGSSAAFYFANENKPENLASSASRLFLGVKLECAQCHAHPFASWKREQFWEFAAFFRTINPSQPIDLNGAQPVAVGRNEIQIPGTNTVVKAKFLDGTNPEWKDNDYPPQVLAEWVSNAKNPYFAKATADFLWSYFFGVSLLEQIEHADAEDSISNPDLLQVLAEELVNHNFDLKFLMRAIVHTEAYQRTTQGGAGDHQEVALFARMQVRGLTGEQVYDSVLAAIGAKRETTPQFNNNAFVQPGQPMNLRGQFLTRFNGEEKAGERQTSILQALFLMNNKELADKVKMQNNESLRTIATGTSYENTGARIRSLYMWVLSRPPRSEEVERLARYVDSGGPTRDRTRAFEDVFWVLLNSGEFLLNH